mgnify:CR=1 FL=1
MKKQYLEPTVEVMELESEILMNVTSGETGEAGTGEGEGDGEDLAGGHRGSWGSLWD